MRSITVCLGLLLLFSAPSAGWGEQRSEIHLTVTATGARKIRLICRAAPSVNLRQPALSQVARVLSFDLSQSNRFLLVKPKAGPAADQRPKQSTSAEAAPKDPQADIEAVWEASISHNKLLFAAKVCDCRTDRLVFARRFLVPMEQLRTVVHQFSDEMVLMFSGRRGIAHCRIAFVSDATGCKELYVADYDGRNVRRLTSFGGIVLSPAFSPRGDRIAFVKFERDRPVLAVLDVVRGKSTVLVRSNGVVAAPTWSPDGKKIALSISDSGNSDVYLLDVSSGRLRRLTYSRWIETSPSFSPNGRSIAFVSDRTGRPEVYVMSVDGTGIRRITFDGTYNESPAWSPDGGLIAYVSYRGDRFELWVATPDGQGARPIVSGVSAPEGPAWSPDGQKLLFSARMGSSSSSLYWVNPDGSGLTEVVAGLGNCTEPCWSP